MRTEIDIIAQKAWAREEGKAEGRAEGRAEERADIARNLKTRGMNIDEIAEITSLPREAIAAL